MYAEPKRVEFLDSIRGMAALFVLFSHTFDSFDWPVAWRQFIQIPFISILFSGKEAVCMFFVLSGYVLARPYVVTAENAPPRKLFLPTFYLRRFTRIWLPWFFVFVLSILAQRFWFHPPPTDPPISKWLAGFWQIPPNARDFFLQCIFQLHDLTRQLLAQDWSLGIELKGSLLIPLFLFLLPGKRCLLLLLCAVALLTFLNHGHYFVSFIIGVLLAGYGDRCTPPLARSRWIVKLLFLVFGLAVYQAFSVLLGNFPETRPLYKCGWVLSSLGCACLLLSSFSSRTIEKWLSWRPFVLLGRISYSLYLVQFIVILCLLPPLVHVANQWGIENRAALLALTFLASVLVTTGFSALTYRLIEVPAINLGHHLTKKIQRHFPH